MKTIRLKTPIADQDGGLALALTLVMLVVLASVAAFLSAQVSRARHRQQYIIDYQQARYGLDSAMRYMLTVMPQKQFSLVNRSDAPDFSDLFWMTRQQYDQYIDNWASRADPEQIKKYTPATEPNEPADPNETNNEPNEITALDPNQIEVPGPYGPPWPYVIKPVEIEIGSAKVRITVEDENAKMPLSWAATSGKLENNRQAMAALETFAGWMQMDKERFAELLVQLDEIGQKKVFAINQSSILLQTPAAAGQQRQNQFTTSRQRRTASPPQPRQQTRQQMLRERPAAVHATDFARLFHSSLLDIESLSQPAPDRAFENESYAKYLSLWGSQRVNVNTATRQVLEAAFAFGGKAEELADKIIEARREKPFRDMAALRDALLGDSDAIDRAKDYIDTSSNFFSIHIESASGTARVWAVATVIRERQQVQLLAIMYGR